MKILIATIFALLFAGYANAQTVAEPGGVAHQTPPLSCPFIGTNSRGLYVCSPTPGGGGSGISISSLGAQCNGSDETSVLINAISLVGAGTQLIINCPIFIGSPASVTASAGSQLAFSGNGQIQTAFGGVTALNVITPGAYTNTCPGVTLSGNGTVGTVACQLVGVTLNSTVGLGYTPGDVVACSGGTPTVACAVRMLTTSVASATPVAGGTGGGSVTCQVRGTTGTGLRGLSNIVVANVTTVGGAITAVNSIANAGSYQSNPTDLTAEPVLPVTGTGCNGLTGATLALTMQVDIYEVQNGGRYTALPSTPTPLTGGNGAGATITTATWGLDSISVAAAGTYSTASPPTITVAAGAQVTPAYVQPIGQAMMVNGNIVAGNQQIFGGYGVIGGTPVNPEFPVYWWGAKCTGAGDDTLAIQSALTSATQMNYGAKLRLPPGRCVLTDAIRATLTANTALTFAGAGPNTSELIQTGDADGLSIVYNSGAFYTRDATNLPGVGVTFSGFGVINAGSLDTRSAIKIVGDFVNGRPNPKTVFQDIIIHTDINDTSTHIWHIGFDILDLPNVSWLRNECYGSGSHTVTATGAEALTIGTCIQIDGEAGQNTALSGATTVYFIDNLETYFGYGVNIKGFVQGVYLNNLALIHCQICFNWQSKNRQSDLHMTSFYMDSYLGDVQASQISWVQLGNGTFNCVGGGGPCTDNTNVVTSCVDRATFTGVTFAGGDVGLDFRSKYCGGSFLQTAIVGVVFSTTGTAAAYPNGKIIADDPAGEPFTYMGPGLGLSGIGQSGFGSVQLGDYRQSVKGIYSAAIGTNNTSTGSASMAIGNGNIVTGNQSAAIGIGSNAGGDNSFVFGNFGDDNHRNCGIVNSSGDYTGLGRGHAQTTSSCVLRGQTTNDTPKILTTDGSGVPSVYDWLLDTGENNCFNMPRSSGTNLPVRASALLRIDVVGKNRTENTKAYYSTGEVGILTQGSSGVTSWTEITPATAGQTGSGAASSVAYTIDTTNFCLNITVTAPAATTDTWDWTANVHAVEAR